jgi:hypothetical protein
MPRVERRPRAVRHRSPAAGGELPSGTAARTTATAADQGECELARSHSERAIVDHAQLVKRNILFHRDDFVRVGLGYRARSMVRAAGPLHHEQPVPPAPRPASLEASERACATRPSPSPRRRQPATREAARLPARPARRIRCLGARHSPSPPRSSFPPNRPMHRNRSERPCGRGRPPPCIRVHHR